MTDMCLLGQHVANMLPTCHTSINQVEQLIYYAICKKKFNYDWEKVSTPEKTQCPIPHCSDVSPELHPSVKSPLSNHMQSPV
jgi:hypothetical protein